MENNIVLREITQSEFETMGDAELIWYCIESVILNIRGKNISVKLHAYEGLTEGQRVLLMFQILYGHSSNGVREFFYGSYYLDKQGFWPQLKQAIATIGDTALLPLLGEIEQTYDMFKGNSEQTNQQIESRIAGIDECLAKALPETVKLTAAYIRRYPNEFVVIR